MRGEGLRCSRRVEVFILTAVCAILFALAPSPGTAAPAAAPLPPPKAEVELKLATLAPDGTTFVRIFHEMDAEVRLKTGNKVGFKLYPGGVMGEEKSVLSKIKLGQLQGGAFTGMGLGEILPAVRVEEIPFLFRTYEEADAASASVNEEISRLLEEEGWVDLGRGEIGFVYLFTVHKVSTIEELRKTKLVILSGDPLANLAMEVGGLNPISQNVTDVLTSLATGTIDAVYIPPAYAIALQWNTKTKFILDYPFTNGTGGTIVRQDYFEKIPAELRPTVIEIARRHAAEVTREIRKEGVDAIEQMKKQGIQVVDPSPEQMGELIRISTEVRSKLPAALYPGNPATQEKVRGLVATVVKTVEELRAKKSASAAAVPAVPPGSPAPSKKAR